MYIWTVCYNLKRLFYKLINLLTNNKTIAIFTSKILSVYTGALSYRVLLRNDKTKEEENFKSETDNIDLEGLNPGTWYEAMVFSTGVYQENPEGSEVTLVQTGKVIFKLLIFVLTSF